MHLLAAQAGALQQAGEAAEVGARVPPRGGEARLGRAPPQLGLDDGGEPLEGAEFVERARDRAGIVAIEPAHARERCLAFVAAHLFGLRRRREQPVGVDRHGTVLTFNHSAERMFGYAAHEVLGAVPVGAPRASASVRMARITAFMSPRTPSPLLWNAAATRPT